MRRRCYYEVLQVGLTATLGEIRHSYHKLAKKWHPDKNSTSIAKQHFQEINEAYSVLSDPREKTWYDRHRETIVKNWNAGMQTTDLIPGKGNVLTNEETIWPFFVRPAYIGYDNSESGFYTVYRNVFNVIKAGVESMNALVYESEDPDENRERTLEVIVKAPSFGDSETKLSCVAQFYFFWEDLPDIIEATWVNLSYSGLRNSQEIIPEEDLEERENIQRSYIEIIRSLVQYVKLHDPRYRRYMEDRAPIDYSDEEETVGNQIISFPDDEIEEETIVPYRNHKHDEMNEACEECWDWALINLKDLLKYKFKNKLPASIKKEQLQLPMSDEEEKEEQGTLKKFDKEGFPLNKIYAQGKFEDELN